MDDNFLSLALVLVGVEAAASEGVEERARRPPAEGAGEEEGDEALDRRPPRPLEDESSVWETGRVEGFRRGLN